MGQDDGTSKNTRAGLAVGLMLTIGGIATGAPAQEAADLPPALQVKLKSGAAICAEFENGTFGFDPGAVRRVDLDGDGQLDWVLDEFGFTCSSAASLFCGTGGCMSHFLVGETVASILNRGWDVVSFGPQPVVLADVHGSLCGGINPTPCVTASVWDEAEKVWRSVAQDWE